MSERKYAIIVVVLAVIIALLFSAFTLTRLVSSPSEEKFSEFYLLGPQRLAEEYPHNVVPGQLYSVFFVVGNHVGSPANYLVKVKLLNDTDILPNVTARKASPLQPLQEYSYLIENENVKEQKIDFLISNAAVSENQFLVSIIQLNGQRLEINKSASWDSNKLGYSFKLLFELWIFNELLGEFEFDNRYVYIELNCPSIS